MRKLSEDRDQVKQMVNQLIAMRDYHRDRIKYHHAMCKDETLVSEVREISSAMLTMHYSVSGGIEHAIARLDVAAARMQDYSQAVDIV